MDKLISLVMEYYLYILAVVGFAVIVASSLAGSDLPDLDELPDKSRQVGVGRVTLELIKK